MAFEKNSDEPEVLWVLGDRYRLLHTSHAASIIEVEGAHGHGPPPHRHQQEMEFFYVLDGELAAEVEGEHMVLKAGQSLSVDPGALHTYKTLSERSRHITVITPGDFVQLFRAIGHPQEGEGDPGEDVKKLLALAPQYGLEVPGKTS